MKNLNELKNKNLKYIFLLLPLIIFLIIFFFNNFFISIKNFLPTCLFREITGFYCPGCGNTRAVIALLHGDILTSLRYNVAPISLLIVATLLYIEFIFSLFNKKIQLLSRNPVLWIIVGILLTCYYIFRNFFPYFTPK